MASVLEFALDDVINGIGTPVEWVKCPASCSAAATPLVSEDDLSAVIIERGGVPVGEARVRDGINTLRVQRVRNIK